MKFVPVPGTKVLICIHETRRKDYATYALAAPKVESIWKAPTANISGNKRPVPTGESYPVEFTSWEDAHGFCAWLSRKEGRTYRLPTDHEWSCAVGIGDREAPAASPESKAGKIKDVYPWGTQWPPPKGAGNYWDLSAVKEFHPKKTEQTRYWKGYLDGYGYDDGFPFSSPVMSFAPNELGIYDLGGNAYEVVEDAFSPTNTDVTYRGASWGFNGQNLMLSSSRVHQPKTWRGGGFRCVLETAAP